MTHYLHFVTIAITTPLSITHTSIARTHQFRIVKCPHHPYPSFVSKLGNDGRKLSMDIVEMYYLGAKIV